MEWNFGPNNEPIDDDCCGQGCCHEENEANANAADYDAWWDSLTDDQKLALDETFNALQEFIQEYSDMFDVTSDTARKLQGAYWAFRSEFNTGD